MEIIGLAVLLILYLYLDAPGRTEPAVVEYIDERDSILPKEEVVTSA